MQKKVPIRNAAASASSLPGASGGPSFITHDRGGSTPDFSSGMSRVSSGIVLPPLRNDTGATSQTENREQKIISDALKQTSGTTSAKDIGGVDASEKLILENAELRRNLNTLQNSVLQSMRSSKNQRFIAGGHFRGAPRKGPGGNEMNLDQVMSILQSKTELVKQLQAQNQEQRDNLLDALSKTKQQGQLIADLTEARDQFERDLKLAHNAHDATKQQAQEFCEQVVIAEKSRDRMEDLLNESIDVQQKLENSLDEHKINHTSYKNSMEEKHEVVVEKLSTTEEQFSISRRELQAAKDALSKSSGRAVKLMCSFMSRGDVATAFRGWANMLKEQRLERLTGSVETLEQDKSELVEQVGSLEEGKNKLETDKEHLKKELEQTQRVSKGFEDEIARLRSQAGDVNGLSAGLEEALTKLTTTEERNVKIQSEYHFQLLFILIFSRVQFDSIFQRIVFIEHARRSIVIFLLEIWFQNSFLYQCIPKQAGSDEGPIR